MRISTNNIRAVKIFGSDKAYKVLADIGYDCIDYGQTCSMYQVRDGIYSASEKEFTEFFMQEERYISQAGIFTAQTHAPFPTYPEDGPANYPDMIAALKRCIYATKLLKSKYMVIHPAMPAGWGIDKDPERTKEINLELLRELTAVAKEHDVVLALENMPLTHIPCSSSQELLFYLKEINSKYLCVCFDTGHANISVPQGHVLEMAEELGSTIKVLHVHDNDGKGDMHTTPYMGTIEWEKLMGIFANFGYDGVFNLESDSFPRHYPDELYIESETLMLKTAKYLAGLIEGGRAKA